MAQWYAESIGGPGTFYILMIVILVSFGIVVIRNENAFWQDIDVIMKVDDFIIKESLLICDERLIIEESYLLGLDCTVDLPQADYERVYNELSLVSIWLDDKKVVLDKQLEDLINKWKNH
jgi:hypothetical protein